MQLPIDPASVTGFLHPDEGAELYRRGAEQAPQGPCLEVGSYCGLSTLYLGSAVRGRGGVLFAVDHHRGSEEHQPGEEYHDPALLDAASGRMDSFRAFRDTVDRAGLTDTVVPLVAPSAVAARAWRTPLALVFIDGGHAFETVLTDWRCWGPWVQPGGLLLVHDLFDDPAEGGQAPIEVFRLALASGLFEELPRVGTLGVLRRLGQ